MAALALTALEIANLRAALQGTGMSDAHVKGMIDHLLITMPAQLLANIGNVLKSVADVTALKAVDVTTLSDKALVYVEGTGQLFAFDAQSSAGEVLGPPATVVAPNTGSGRYLVIVGTTAYVDARIRYVADNAALKAVDVTTLVDKALVLKEDSEQLFHYDSGSAAAEVLGPPAVVISPTAGAGRYIAMSAIEQRLRVCENTTAVKALIVATLADRALIVKEDTQELFVYDAGSAATEILGPPALVIAPDSGAGRYLSTALYEKRLRVVADTTTLKALVVGGLSDKCLIYKEDTAQLFAYDSGSSATEALGPPATVVQPDAGAGRYLALTLGGPAAAPTLGLYGDGSDGAAVFADQGTAPTGTTKTDNTAGATIFRLDRDVFWTTFQVNATVTVRTNGFVIHHTSAAGLISGTVENNGVGGVAGGAGGAGGTLAAGGNAGADKAGAGAGNNGTGVDPGVGGNGAAGGNDDGVPTNAGGTAGAATAPAVGRGALRSLPAAAVGVLFGATGITAAKPGGGGGSGGAAAGSTGGAGGGGGGGLIIRGRGIKIAATGVVRANGGAGKAGSGAAAGGGGGGGGGFVILISDVLEEVGGSTVQAAAGAGGAGAGTGTAGATATAGMVIKLKV